MTEETLPYVSDRELFRLRRELAHSKSTNLSKDVSDVHAKSGWFDALVSACAARGFPGDEQRPYNGPWKLIDAWDSVMGPEPSLPSVGTAVVGGAATLP